MTKILSCISELDDFKNKDFYQILGISRDASQEEITKAYRKMARKFHPDLNVSDTTEKMKVINEAYDTLSDVDKRKEYDKKFNVVNEKAYSTYTKSQEESEADLDDWLKAYLSRRRLLNNLYEMYIKNESIIMKMRSYYMSPSQSDLLVSKVLIKEIREALASLLSNSLDKPEKLLDYLFTELKSPMNRVYELERSFMSPFEEDLVKLSLFSNEIMLVVEKFGNESHPQFHSFIEYILKRYYKEANINSNYRKNYFRLEPFREYIETLLDSIIKAHKDYINGLINKRDS